MSEQKMLWLKSALCLFVLIASIVSALWAGFGLAYEVTIPAWVIGLIAALVAFGTAFFAAVIIGVLILEAVEKRPLHRHAARRRAT